MIYGYSRGLIKEILSILSLLVSVYISINIYPNISIFIKEYIDLAVFADSVSFALMFLFLYALINIFSNNEKYSIAFGCGSMFNHSDEPNIHWKFTNDNNIKFIANKNINKNTELTINYGKPYWKAREKIKN